MQAGAGAASTHSEMDRTKHASRRRVLDHAFSEKALSSVEPFIYDNIKIWCKQLGDGERDPEGWTAAKNMSEWNSYLSYDIMGDLTFGKRFRCLEAEDYRYVPGVMVIGNGFIYSLSHHPFLSLLLPILRSQILLRYGGELGRKTLAFVDHTKSQMDQRIAARKDTSSENRKDFMHHILEAKDPETGRGFTRTELDSEAGLLITAGSDTSSTAITATLFYLLHNPGTLEKATTEVRNRFSSVDDIRGISLNAELPYLNACIDESLRMAPPVPSQLPREVLAGGITVDGHYIPPGVVVGVSPYVIHHNPEYYPEPFAFRPERWIVDEKTGVGEESVAKARAAFCPFSLGTRGCIGKKVAYIELLSSLGTLLYTYDMRLPVVGKQTGGGDPASKVWGRQRIGVYQLQDKFLADRDGPMVEFRARS